MIDALPEGETLINMWFRLLVLAGNVNDNGFIYVSKEIPYTPETLAAYWNKPLATVKMALGTFEKLGMIEIVDNFLHLSNWERYQNTEALERIREKGRQRTARFREKQKLLAEPIDGNVTVTSQVTLRNGTDIDIDKDIDKEIEKDISKERHHFTPPTLDQVIAYCKERQNNIDAEYFLDYYQARGWYLSNGKKCRDWKSCVRTWERNNKNNRFSPPAQKRLSDIDERQNDYSQILKSLPDALEDY